MRKSAFKKSKPENWMVPTTSYDKFCKTVFTDILDDYKAVSNQNKIDFKAPIRMKRITIEN